MSSVGKGLDRVDARQKVTGTATYAAEVAVANVTYAVIVGSTSATGEVGSIDIAAAKQQPGVLAVLTHENVPKLEGANKREGTEKVVQVLQDAKLHYVDQPVAVVVADTLERAQHAAALVGVTYRGTTDPKIELPAGEIYAPKRTVRGDTDSARGDVAAGLAAAAHKIDQTYTTPNETHNPMEMHATIAVWSGDDSLTLYDSTQGIFGTRARLATIFGIPKERVRVVNHFVGGGFGSKGSPWSHVPLAALAAKVVGRPVKLVVTRQQMFSLVGHRPVTSQHVVVGCDKAGKLTAMMHEVLAETSRFDEFVEPAALATRMLYACPNVSTIHRASRVDVGTPTFTRAPGEASGSFALESALDELAYAANIDPVQLRVVNHAASDAHEQKPFSSKTLLACYQRGAQAFGWAKRARTPRAMRDGQLLVGMGMATATYPARQLPASALAKLRADGTLLVQAGTQDIGTGTYTVMSQIAADASTIAFEKIKFELGDTTLPETPLSAGSFTVSSTGSAVKMTCAKLVEKLVELAVADGPLKGIDPKGILAQDGALVGGGKRDSFVDILKRSGAPELVVEHKTMPSKERDKYSMHSFGAVFVEVHVDEDLGRIQVTRVTGAWAAGKIMNAKTARSQYLGGVVWGIGMALQEHAVRDPRTARIVTRDLADYHVPVNADIPPIDVIMVDERDDFVNELGAKGIGEISMVGTAAAIANAVYHATGKRIRDLPLTLDKLLPEVRAWKIATFNINDINKRLPVLLEWLATESPDVACLQELKSSTKQFPAAALKAEGYHAVWVGQPSWNGVAILSKTPPILVRSALPGDETDTHARYIEAAVLGMLVGCLYAPNGNPQPGPKFDYKLAWLDRLHAHAATLVDNGVPVILAGDYNVVPTDEDIYNTRSWKKDALLQPAPRARFAKLMAQGWLDALLERQGRKAYTFWDYMRNAWDRDAGLRIDHLLLNTTLAPKLAGAGVDRWVRSLDKASDHAPAWVELA